MLFSCVLIILLFCITFQNIGLNGRDTLTQLFQFLICGKINIERTIHFFVAPPCMGPFLLDEPFNRNFHHMSPIQVFSTRCDYVMRERATCLSILGWKTNKLKPSTFTSVVNREAVIFPSVLKISFNILSLREDCSLFLKKGHG